MSVEQYLHSRRFSEATPQHHHGQHVLTILLTVLPFPIAAASLLRIFSDRSFHRSGFCIAGDDEAVGKAVVAVAALATKRIDLSTPEHA